MEKRLYYIGFGAYAVMLLLSVLFYKERMTFLDGSYVLFHIIRKGTFCIEHFRYGAALAQIYPLLALKLGLSMNAIMVSYSAGYILNYFFCYVICGSLLKQYRIALVVLLINLLFVTYTFYWPVSELPQGLLICMVVFALIWGRSKPATWGLVVVALVALTFFHPMMFFAMAYTLVFFMLRKDINLDRRVVYVVAAIFFAAAVAKQLLVKSQYEADAMGATNNFVRLFPNYFTNHSNRQFLYNCLTRYCWIPLVSLSILSVYRANKEPKKLVFFIVSVVGYLILVNVSYPTKYTGNFYLENLYLPIGLFLGLPFIFDVLPVLELKKLALPVFLLIVVSGCARIFLAHDVYTKRLDLERSVIARFENKKVILNAGNFDRNILQMLWGTPYELLLLSVAEHHKPASIIIDDDPKWRPWVVDQKKALLVNWNIYEYAQLNQQYFHFTDTTSGYIIDPVGQ